MDTKDPVIAEVAHRWQVTIGLSTLRVLWLGVALSTVYNAIAMWHFNDSPPEWDTTFIVPSIALGIVFGFFAFRLSLRVMRGPRKPATKPFARLFVTMLLALLLAWLLHVFGMVCVMSGAPPFPILMIFFVPAWGLFLMSWPTRTKLRRWTGRPPDSAFAT